MRLPVRPGFLNCSLHPVDRTEIHTILMGEMAADPNGRSLRVQRGTDPLTSRSLGVQIPERLLMNMNP